MKKPQTVKIFYILTQASYRFPKNTKRKEWDVRLSAHPILYIYYKSESYNVCFDSQTALRSTFLIKPCKTLPGPSSVNCVA